VCLGRSTRQSSDSAIRFAQRYAGHAESVGLAFCERENLSRTRYLGSARQVIRVRCTVL
jgi:hypothetical protein